MPGTRPYRNLKDATLEDAYRAIGQLFVVDFMLKPETRHDLAKLCADLSLERNARLAQRWEPAADDDAPDGQYDDRWHAMKRD